MEITENVAVVLSGKPYLRHWSAPSQGEETGYCRIVPAEPPAAGRTAFLRPRTGSLRQHRERPTPPVASESGSLQSFTETR